MPKDIYQCKHCGDRYLNKIVYCRYCKTAEQRKKIDEENEKIRLENLKKIPHLLCKEAK